MLVWHPDRRADGTASSRDQGSRSTTHTPARADSFCLSYLLGQAPTLYEDGAAIRDYVNIDDVVDANILVLTDERAAGASFQRRRRGKAILTTRAFADIVKKTVRFRPAREWSPVSTGSAIPVISSLTSAPSGPWGGNLGVRQASR